MNNLEQLDTGSLNSLLNNSNASLIPESLVTTITVSFIVLNVLGVLFLVFYVFTVIRKWKVQSAILNMQKDLAQIKASMVPPPPTSPAAPSNNTLVAAADERQE
jgi:hypothetical protein